MRRLCKVLGHQWDGDYDPACERKNCGYRLADGASDFLRERGGTTYMGNGRYGYVPAQEGSRRDPADALAEVRRINDMPSWRPS